MNRLGFAVAAAVLVSLAARPAAGAAADNVDLLKMRLQSGVLRFGGDAEGGAPYVFPDPTDPGRIVGFEVELGRMLAEELGRRVGFKVQAEVAPYEWVSLKLGLERGDFDCILNGYEITPERERSLLFTRPYYIYSQQLVVRADDERIKDLADCRGKVVGTLSGSAADDILQKSAVARIAGFDDQTGPYRDLALGRVDAVLLDTPIAIYCAGRNPALKFVGNRLGQGGYGIALRPDDRALAAALDDAVAKLIVSGRLARLYRRWHLWNTDQADLARGTREQKENELRGLGFDGARHPLLAKELPATELVDLDVFGTAGRLMTFDRYAPLLFKAAGMTVFLTVASMALAMMIGLVVCLCRLYGAGPLRWLALAYVEFFRGTPLLLLLYLLYFGLPELFKFLGYDGVQLPAWLTAIIGFGMNYAAYEAEIYRSSISSVPRGQWEAARALGMSEPLAFRRVVFPQAIRTALGPITNDFVAMFKDTSLVSVIAVRELTKQYLVLTRSGGDFVELSVLTAVLYLAMSVPLGYLSRYLEQLWGPGKH